MRFGICFTHVRFVYLYICVCDYVWYCLYNLYIWCSLAFCIHIPYTPILLAYFSAFCRCQRLTSISSTSRPLAEFDVKSPWCASIFPILSEISHDLTWFDMIIMISVFQMFQANESSNSLSPKQAQGVLATCWQHVTHVTHVMRWAAQDVPNPVPLLPSGGRRETEGPKGTASAPRTLELRQSSGVTWIEGRGPNWWSLEKHPRMCKFFVDCNLSPRFSDIVISCYISLLHIYIYYMYNICIYYIWYIYYLMHNICIHCGPEIDMVHLQSLCSKTRKSSWKVNSPSYGKKSTPMAKNCGRTSLVHLTRERCWFF